MVAVDCLVEAGDWPDGDALSRLAERSIEAACARTLPSRGERAGEVSIVFTDDAHIRRLNAEWRGKDAATNVLSFPGTSATGSGVPLLMGDIVVSCETLRREAEAEGKSFDDHLTHLIVHGFLHLLGHDHETEVEAEEMEDLERRILLSLAIADPYA